MMRISFSANYFKIVDQSLTMNTPFVRRTLGVGNLYTLPRGEKDRFFANIARVRRKTGNVEKRLVTTPRQGLWSCH